MWEITSLVLTRTFQIDRLRLYSRRSLKLQLGEARSLGSVSRALAQVTPFGACGFLLINTYQGYYTLQVCPNLFYREKYLYIYIYKTLAQGEDFKAKYLLKRDFLAEIKWNVGTEPKAKGVINS